MANAGMDIKKLQYAMEHSDVSVTLNVYTHASFDHAAEQMWSATVFLRIRILKTESVENKARSAVIVFSGLLLFRKQ